MISLIPSTLIGSPMGFLLQQARLPGLRLLGFLLMILVVLAIIYVAKKIVSK